MAQLFSSRTAFFSPLLPPSSRALWCHHGGTIATLNSVQQLQPVHAFFGAYGHEDELIERLEALEINVLDVSYLYECVRQSTLLPVTTFLFSAMKLAEERRQLDELAAVAEQACSPSSDHRALPSKLSQTTVCTPDTSISLRNTSKLSQLSSPRSSPSSHSSQRIAEMLLPSPQAARVAAGSNTEATETDELSQEPPKTDLRMLLTAIEEEPDEQLEGGLGDGDEVEQQSSPQAGIADDSACFEVGVEPLAETGPECSLDDQKASRQAAFKAVYHDSDSVSIVPDSEPDEAKVTRDVSTDAPEHTEAAPKPNTDTGPELKLPSDAMEAEEPQVDHARSPTRSPSASVAMKAPQQDLTAIEASPPPANTPAAPTSSLADVSLAAQLSSSQMRSLPSSEIDNDDVLMDAQRCAGGRVDEKETTLEAASEDAEEGEAPRSQKKARFADPVEVGAEEGKHLETEQESNGRLATVHGHPVRVRSSLLSSSVPTRGPFSRPSPSLRKTPPRPTTPRPSISTSAAEPASQLTPSQPTSQPTPHYSYPSFYSALFLPSPPCPSSPEMQSLAQLATPDSAEDVKPIIVPIPPPEIAIRDFFKELPTALPELRLSEGSQSSSSQSGGAEAGVRKGLRELRRDEGGFEAKKRERRK